MRIKKLIDDRYWLIAILLVAAVLRFYRLGSNPPHLTPDEAALGYNAYSILKTGRDEYGEILPIIFKSFGDFKPGFYVYLTVPFVALLGLNEVAVRAPSALAGVGVVLLVYAMVLKLFGEKRLALIAAVMTAINPWAIHFSRGAWEVNISLMLTLVGVYFFLKALEKEKYLVGSALMFGLTLLTYQGAKLSSGIILVILVGLYYRKVVKIEKKILASAFLVGLIVAVPIITGLFSGKAGRLVVFSVFSYPRPEEYLKSFLDQAGVKLGGINYYLFYSEKLNFARGILGRWFNHFSGRFLFFEGDWQNLRHSAPNYGMLLWADLVGLLAGLYVLVRKKFNREAVLIIVWMVLAPLPAVLSRDQVHAVRAFNLMVPLMMTTALGVDWVIANFNRLKWGLILVYVISLVYYLDALLVHLPVHDSQKWEYGYKQIVETVTPIQSEYREIRVQQSFAQPYIYFLFYQKYDPAKYQKQAKLIESDYKGDVGKVEWLDNIYFGPIDWTVNRGKMDTLFVGDTIRIPVADSSDPEHFELIRQINYLNGKTAFRIIKVIK